MTKSIVSLIAIAIGTILYSCGTSIHAIFPGNDAFRPELIKSGIDEQEEITLTTFTTMLISSSIMLLLIFYLLQSIVNILKFMVLISGTASISFVIWDWIFLLYRSKYSEYVAYISSALITLLWFKTEHWLITNFMVFCFIVCGINLLKIRRFQTILIVAVGFLIYDVWWVFISPLFFGKSVMEVAARTAAPHIPAAITAPSDDGTGSLLGAGDILLPGIVLDFFIRFDCVYQANLFEVSMGGYVFGIILAYMMVIIMGKGQPALLWIFPAVLIPTTVMAIYKGVWKQLWKEGTEKFDKKETGSEEETGALLVNVDFGETISD